jgi:hypothetical protein
LTFLSNGECSTVKTRQVIIILNTAKKYFQSHSMSGLMTGQIVVTGNGIKWDWNRNKIVEG